MENRKSFGQKEFDLYSDFNDYNPNFDPQSFEGDEHFQNAVQNVKDKRPPPTAARLKTSSKRGLVVPPSSMGIRPITGAQDGGVGRPLTAVRAAGYSSKDSHFEGLNQTSKVSPIIFEQKNPNRPEEIIKFSEKAINRLLDESCLANARGEYQLALERAKEAERQEKLLMDKKKRLTPNIEQVNLDLNYAVRFNLAIQQTANNMDNEAIATYQSLIKSRAFNHSGRLKVNIGNIYFKLRNFEKAVKFYKMALDQVSQEHKSMNTKIRLNICATYVKMNLFQDAATVLELIMDQEPTIKTAFTLTLCYYLLGDCDLMKRTFERMLVLDLEPSEDEKYMDSSDDPQHATMLEVIRNDSLRQIEKQKINEAEQSIMMAAKIISGAVDANYSVGYDWCINLVRSSNYMSLAHDLDIDKAISYLKQKDFQQAIETLKSFEKKDSKVASAAATNLSFLYNLENQPSQADKYAEVALQSDRYNPAALVNKGNVLYKRGDLERAREYYNEALQNDSSCIEALYNFGLTNKKLGRYNEAHDCFTKLLNILRSHPQVLFQLADINSLMGNQDQAKEWLMQVNTMVPSDPMVIRQLAEMFEAEDDKIQALHYYSEACKYDPTNIAVLEWLGSYFVESQMPENAIQYFERGAFLQPGQAKWPLMIASCFRRIGSYQQAHEFYKHIHRRFPDNIECLKILAKFCIDMNLEDAKKYTDKLKEAEKSHQLREERAASGRTRSGKSWSDQGSNSRQSSGGLNRGSQSRQSSAGMGQGSPPNSTGQGVDRPRTAARRGERSNMDDFEDEEIGDDLLPE